MEWDTGKTLATIILVLLIAIIAWFMTRAGRKRAAERYAEARRRDDVGATSGAGTVAAREAGAIDARGAGAGTGARGAPAPAPLDVAVHRSAADGASPGSGSGGAHRSDAVHLDGITSVETDRPAHGGERFEPVGDTDPGPAAEALTEARAARLGVTADPAAPEIGADAGPGDPGAATGAGTSPGTGARAPDGPAAFSAPNVELKETDGSLRSQGSGRDVADVAPGMPGAPDRGPAGPSGAPGDPPTTSSGAGAGEGSESSTAAKLAAGAAAVAAAAGTVAAARAGRDELAARRRRRLADGLGAEPGRRDRPTPECLGRARRVLGPERRAQGDRREPALPGRR